MTVSSRLCSLTVVASGLPNLKEPIRSSGIFWTEETSTKHRRRLANASRGAHRRSPPPGARHAARCSSNNKKLQVFPFSGKSRWTAAQSGRGRPFAATESGGGSRTSSASSAGGACPQGWRRSCFWRCRRRTASAHRGSFAWAISVQALHRSLWKRGEAMPISGSPNGARHPRSQAGRDCPEQVAASLTINWNSRSQSSCAQPNDQPQTAQKVELSGPSSGALRADPRRP
jgi:hypothetical protein